MWWGDKEIAKKIMGKVGGFWNRQVKERTYKWKEWTAWEGTWVRQDKGWKKNFGNYEGKRKEKTRYVQVRRKDGVSRIKEYRRATIPSKGTVLVRN